MIFKRRESWGNFTQNLLLTVHIFWYIMKMQMRLCLWKIIKIAGQLEAVQKSTGTQEGERGQILIIHDWEESDIFLDDGHFCILNVVYQTIQIH